jgi:hypothetical protein
LRSRGIGGVRRSEIPERPKDDGELAIVLPLQLLDLTSEVGVRKCVFAQADKGARGLSGAAVET